MVPFWGQKNLFCTPCAMETFDFGNGSMARVLEALLLRAPRLWRIIFGEPYGRGGVYITQGYRLNFQELSVKPLTRQVGHRD